MHTHKVDLFNVSLVESITARRFIQDLLGKTEQSTTTSSSTSVLDNFSEDIFDITMTEGFVLFKRREPRQ
jgi:hypothetical protein